MPSPLTDLETANHFAVLVDDDCDDPSHLIATQLQKLSVKKPAVRVSTERIPSNSPAPAPAGEFCLNDALRNGNGAPVRGGGGRGMTGRGGSRRGGGFVQSRYLGNGNGNGYHRRVLNGDDGNNGRVWEWDRGSFGRAQESFRGGRSGGLANGNGGPQGRVYERRNGAGRGFDMSRDGAAFGKSGTVADDLVAQEAEKGVNLQEKAISSEKLEQKQGQVVNGSKEKGDASNEAERKEPEDKEMTLEEYEKVREEKRKTLLSMKVEERKVEFDEDLKEMQQLSVKKENHEVFIKLGSDKDFSKRKEYTEKEERARKAMHIDEFLKPKEGARRYSPGGPGRGRARGLLRGGNSANLSAAQAPVSIEDQAQFPALGGK